MGTHISGVPLLEGLPLILLRNAIIDEEAIVAMQQLIHNIHTI